MKKFYQFIFLLLISCNPLMAKEGIDLKIGAYELPPHMYLRGDGKTIDGSLYHYIQKEIVTPLNLRADWSFHPFSRLLMEIDKGNIHLMSFLAKNSEREKILDFPKAPTYKTFSVLIFRRGYAPKELNYDELHGKLVGHTQGSIVPDFLLKKGVKIEFLAGENSLERNLEKLKRKRLDAVFAPTKSHAEFMLQKTGFEKDLMVVPLKDSEIELYLAVSKKLPTQLREKILKRIEQLGDKYYQDYNRRSSIYSLSGGF